MPEAGQPGTPAGHPAVGVGPVCQPGRGRDHPERGGEQAGPAVPDQSVPSAVPVLGRQQAQRREHARQGEAAGQFGDDACPVIGVAARRRDLPADPPQGPQRCRLTADPGQPYGGTGHDGRTYIEERGHVHGGDEDEHGGGRQHRERAGRAEAPQADPATAAPSAIVTGQGFLVSGHCLLRPVVAGLPRTPPGWLPRHLPRARRLPPRPRLPPPLPSVRRPPQLNARCLLVQG